MREKVMLVSTESPYFYTVYINKKNMAANGTGKLEIMKYDPIVRKHVLFKQKKISK